MTSYVHIISLHPEWKTCFPVFRFQAVRGPVNAILIYKQNMRALILWAIGWLFDAYHHLATLPQNRLSNGEVRPSWRFMHVRPAEWPCHLRAVYSLQSEPFLRLIATEIYACNVGQVFWDELIVELEISSRSPQHDHYGRLITHTNSVLGLSLHLAIRTEINTAFDMFAHAVLSERQLRIMGQASRTAHLYWAFDACPFHGVDFQNVRPIDSDDATLLWDSLAASTYNQFMTRMGG